jgi:hypothetical protein
VQGKGRLKAPNAPYLNWSGIIGLDSGVENVMTFECGADQINTVSDISGNLSIVKDGPGELRIEDNIAFSGGLSVKQGLATLVNFNNAPYEYFKLTIKETAASSSNPIYDSYTITQNTTWTGKTSRRFNVGEFGLYDADGKRVNDYQKAWDVGDSIDWTFETLQPGQIAPYPTEGVSVYNNGYNSYAWFAVDDRLAYPSSKYRLAEYHWTAGTGYMQIDNPETHISLVQRLEHEDVGKVAMVDVHFMTLDRSQPTALEVFGSADGEHWDSLFTTNNIEITSSYPKYMWLSDATATSAGAARPESVNHAKFPLPRTTQKPIFDFAAPSSVSVASGATLKLVGSPVEVNKLVVSVSGAGTLEGAFNFAESGTLEIPDLPEDDNAVLPGSYIGCSGFANIANWTVTKGGKLMRRTLSVVDGKIVVSTKGLRVIVK